jgi:hypothetical protein
VRVLKAFRQAFISIYKETLLTSKKKTNTVNVDFLCHFSGNTTKKISFKLM